MSARCRFTRLLVGGLLAVSAVLVSAAASAIPLAAGESFRVRFSLPAPPDSPQLQNFPNHPFRITDTLAGRLNATRVSGIGAPAARITLSDGNTVLGSYSLAFSVPSTSFAFAGPGSLYNFRSTSASSFASIQDATIDGILDFVIESTGNAVFDFDVSALFVGHATQAQGYHPHTPSPQISFQGLLGDDPFMTAANIAEPPTGVLMSLALVGLVSATAFRGQRRRRRLAREQLAARMASVLGRA